MYRDFKVKQTFEKNNIRFRFKKLNDLIFFNQIDIMKNSLTNDNNNDEFFATNFIDNNNVKRNLKKLYMIKMKRDYYQNQ